MSKSRKDYINTQLRRLPSDVCKLRIKKELTEIYKDPPMGISVVPDENDITLTHAIIVGPSGTPYEGGFFYFIIRYPSDYPMKPPVITLKTTDRGKVRFNPNLYACGRVCLSILGTWYGPPWSPVLTLSSVLVSIQSLMNEKPYYNEPGVHEDENSTKSDAYSERIRHETIRVAVCDIVSRNSKDIAGCPKELILIVEKEFLNFYDYYESAVQKRLHLTGEMLDPLDQTKGKFEYETLLTQLRDLKNKLDKNPFPKEIPTGTVPKSIENVEKNECGIVGADSEFSVSGKYDSGEQKSQNFYQKKQNVKIRCESESEGGVSKKLEAEEEKYGHVVEDDDYITNVFLSRDTEDDSDKEEDKDESRTVDEATNLSFRDECNSSGSDTGGDQHSYRRLHESSEEVRKKAESTCLLIEECVAIDRDSDKSEASLVDIDEQTRNISLYEPNVNFRRENTKSETRS